MLLMAKSPDALRDRVYPIGSIREPPLDNGGVGSRVVPESGANTNSSILSKAIIEFVLLPVIRKGAFRRPGVVWRRRIPMMSPLQADLCNGGHWANGEPHTGRIKALRMENTKPVGGFSLALHRFWTWSLIFLCAIVNPHIAIGAFWRSFRDSTCFLDRKSGLQGRNSDSQDGRGSRSGEGGRVPLLVRGTKLLTWKDLPLSPPWRLARAPLDHVPTEGFLASVGRLPRGNMPPYIEIDPFRNSLRPK